MLFRSGPGFVPLVLGGLVAGALGWLAATLLPADDAPGADPAVAALEAEVAELRAALDAGPAAPEAPDLSALEVGLADLASGQEAQAADIADLSTRLDAQSTDGEGGPPVDLSPLREGIASLDARLAALEAAPVADDLSARVDGLSEELGALSARVDEVGAAARDVEAEAEAAARRAALDALAVAVRSGAPYAEVTDGLDDVPAPLAEAAESGVPTQAELAQSFPPLAREALRAARASGAGGDAGIGGFLRAQLGARSLEPREGDDPDAVLSRAEAAVREGRIADALDEIDALPPAARDPLGDWAERARTHVEARAALADYLEG